MNAVMAQRHWLDPLARRLLIATGQIDASQMRSNATAPLQKQALRETQPDTLAVERELMALRLRQNPGLAPRSAQEAALMADLGWRLDVNRATAADWLRLPHCTPHQVDLLLRLRSGGVQLSGPEDLQRLLEIDDDVLLCWLPLLVFRWYASEEPSRSDRLDLNHAPMDVLQRQFSAWPLERLECLVRERRRWPFQDLADLQERLVLPPTVVEELIGKVSFGAGPVGPALPPQTPRQRPA